MQAGSPDTIFSIVTARWIWDSILIRARNFVSACAAERRA
jgi:hypothetical protein